MKLKFKIYIASFFCFLIEPYGFSQDPHFTQFYNSTLTVNPAYTGVFSSKDETNNTTNIRLLSNYRSQWSNSQSPYTTGTVQMDAKLGSQDDVIEENTIQNKFNLGLLCMYDQSLNGAFKSTYFMGSGSLHLALGGGSGFGIGTAKSAIHTKSLGLGFGFVYGNRVVDLSKISFSQQFSSGGFDLTLPNGEFGLNNMKPFFSLNAGLLYQSQDEDKDNKFKLGVSGYHLNKPKQSFLNDANQIVPIRYSFQMEYMKYLGDNFLETKLIYQTQAEIKYLLISTIYNIILPGNLSGDEKQNSIGIGANYRVGDAISPYLALTTDRFRFGFSYDITTSKLKTGLIPARSMEVSMQFILSKSGSQE